MKNVRSEKATACPLCGDTPDSASMVWSDFCQHDICGTCDMALPLDLYDKESALFTAVARFLNLDIWECRKRFLADSIEKTSQQLSHEVETNIIGFLKTGIIRCSAQIDAIDRFLETRARGADMEELAAEEKKMDDALFGSPF